MHFWAIIGPKLLAGCERVKVVAVQLKDELAGLLSQQFRSFPFGELFYFVAVKMQYTFFFKRYSYQVKRVLFILRRI